MKKIKYFLLKTSNSFISLLLSILGFGAIFSFNSCSKNYYYPLYGTPTAFFKIKGNVESELTSNPIPSIRVVSGNDTTSTDKYGNYQFLKELISENQTYSIEFKDIDEETNGNYQTLDTIVELKNYNYSENKDIEINIKLKEKE